MRPRNSRRSPVLAPTMGRVLLLLGAAMSVACTAASTPLDGLDASSAPAPDVGAAPADAAPDAALDPGDDAGDPAADATTAADAGPTPDAGPPLTCGPDPATPLDVRTTAGTVRGAIAAGTTRFLGLPFAAPPVGERRWREPEPPTCEASVHVADRFGPRCPQLSPDGTSFLGDEDCLTLNVWTPALPPTTARPVMVFIHGGGNIYGSAGESAADASFTYDGAALSVAASALVVTIQYRLGGLGFLAHDGLGPHGANWGLHDQRAALTWVRDNIAAFGGDPARVMIFGESAGAVDVCALLAMPSAAGLFSAALMESGGCGQPSIAERRTQGQALVDAAGCGAAADPIACLRALSAEAVVRARPGAVDVATGRGTDWGPAVDGELLPLSPSDALADRGASVPVIVGSNLDETFRAVGVIPSCTAYEDLVRATFPVLAARILAIYPCASYPTARAAFVALTTDVRFTCPTRRTARALAAGPSPAYRYLFTQRLENARTPVGAFHGVELAFVFGGLNVAGYQPSPGEVALSQAIQGYWGALASTGDPNGDGRVVWRPSDADDTYLELAATVREGQGVRTAECDALEQLIP